HYYLIYSVYVSLMLVLVLAHLSNRHFVDSFVEFLILTVLHICQYSFYLGLSLSFFHLSIFLRDQTILLSFFYLYFSLVSLLYYHLLVIYYQIFLLCNLKVSFLNDNELFV